MYDVAIIGAGVVGGLIARTLSAYRLNVCILEKQNDVAKGASCANSAIVHAGFDAKEGSLKARLNVHGARLMPQICAELGVKYRQNGSLVIGFSDQDRETLHELLTRGQANGVEGLALLDGDAARALEPGLSPAVTCALHAPTGGIVCPYELTMAAIGNAMDNGAHLLLDFAVTSIQSQPGRYLLSDGTRTVEARYVVNAAGLYADRIARMVGDASFEIHPRRGEYILLDKISGDLVNHTVFRTPSRMGKGILITPTVDGNLLTGPTAQDIEDKEDKSTTAEGLRAIMSQAMENVPAVRFHRSITSFCGLRAVGSTGDFIIRSPRDGFLHVAGIESPGLSSAPAIGLYVRDLLGEMGLVLEPNPAYLPTRAPMHAFREASIEEKNAYIRKDPTYGHVICRCETVTEGEILHAIRTAPQPRDLDGVKRRTRAQMGRCQGGFCSPAILELLAREMGISQEQVTKCGGASVVLTGRTRTETVTPAQVTADTYDTSNSKEVDRHE